MHFFDRGRIDEHIRLLNTVPCQGNADSIGDLFHTDTFPAPDSHRKLPFPHQQRNIRAGEHDCGSSDCMHRQVPVQQRGIHCPGGIPVNDGSSGPFCKGLNGIPAPRFRGSRDDRHKAEPGKFLCQFIGTVMPAQHRNYIPAVRADDNNRRVCPFIIQQRGNLPDNNPHRHQGHDPLPAAENLCKNFRGIGGCIGTEICSYAFSIGAEIREGDNNSVGHE